MPKYAVRVARSAEKAISGLPAASRARVLDRLDGLTADPFRPRPGADIRRLKQSKEPPLFRLRVGDYRILYFVIGNDILVTEVLHRSKAYRGIE